MRDQPRGIKFDGGARGYRSAEFLIGGDAVRIRRPSADE
jgi:hypothetical protein